MPVLLYCVGILVVAIGAAMIGFGIPNNEFGIGNTLIVAGTTAVSGGLVVFAIGVAVARLQRVVDALATRAPIRSSRPFDTFDPAAAAVAARLPVPPARVPFPPKTKPEFRLDPPVESGPRDVLAQEPHIETAPVAAAPTLPNPDEPPVTVADEAYLSPYSRSDEAEMDRPAAAELDREPAPAPKARTYFDAMWPAEPKPAESKSSETKPAEQKPAEPKVSEFHWSNVRRSEPKPVATKTPVSSDLSDPAAAEDLDEPELKDEVSAPRNVAILKSGVVDGMGYTLYVDGSIEAELPQGTLRFASINELRSHLEKAS